jgi:hypothetical protein
VKKKRKRRPPKNVRSSLYQDWLKVCTDISKTAYVFEYGGRTRVELEGNMYLMSFSEKVFHFISPVGYTFKIPGHFGKSRLSKKPVLALEELQRFLDEMSVLQVMEA